MLHSIVEYYGEHESYRCGYCRSSDTNFSHGMWAHTMTVSDYQDLIDRGWRRSGKYCYKPTMDVTCCPMYTIRCKAQEFKPTKSQKKVLKRFNKFLSGEEKDFRSAGDTDRKMSTSSSLGERELEGESGEQFVETTRQHQDINVANVVTADTEEKETNGECSSVGSSTTKMEVQSGESQLLDTDRKKVIGPDPTKGPCKKAKQLRRERKLEKLKEKGIDVSSLNNINKNKEKQVEDFINELPKEFQKRLEIKLVRTAPPSPEWLATSKETHEVYVKYQTTIHDDKPEKCSEPKFRDFLVQSPLLEEHSETGPPCGYGSFHQQYWLDGKIIAVGVIDILPKCVSSVYFFYDPQYMNLTLGTYGALREISFTRHLHAMCPELKYYYMGYYIHSCCKMRYKGNFYPSYLLCPETYKWFPLKECIRKLEVTPYSRLDPDIDSVDENHPNEGDINYIPVWVKGVVMPYKMYKRKFNKKIDNIDELMEYARLVGTKSAKSLVLVR
ncbi:arginyl-tRNA--protein transferase 1 [Pectinophora gossypiella]|uniref:arginyl-tRNA--protein transferase 1 n=1 Tax=Pectinophora gossypiella TaxID=13191 RepID=UPI00214F3B80|nr:arginyl-tRNA--protein transferase 1 [Pectinophora gossypiella]